MLSQPKSCAFYILKQKMNEETCLPKIHRIVVLYIGCACLLFPCALLVVGIFGLVVAPASVQIIFLLGVFSLPVVLVEIFCAVSLVPAMFSSTVRVSLYNFVPLFLRIGIVIVVLSPGIHFLVLGSSGFLYAKSPVAIEVSQTKSYMVGAYAYSSVQYNSNMRVYLQFSVQQINTSGVIVATVLGNATHSSLSMQNPVLAAFIYNNASGTSLEDAAMNAFKLVANMTGSNNPYAVGDQFPNPDASIYAPIMNQLKQQLNLTKAVFQMVPSDGKPLPFYIAFFASGIACFCIGFFCLLLSPVVGTLLYKRYEAYQQRQEQAEHADGH